MRNKVDYNRKLVLRKVEEIFADENPSEIIEILNEYGLEIWEQERERVQIAILKLSKGNLENLHIEVSAAKGDFRDTLVAAEYPEQSRKGTWNMKDKEKAKRIKAGDRNKYLEWLGE